MAKEKIKKECGSCIYFVGSGIEDGLCLAGQKFTCQRYSSKKCKKYDSETGLSKKAQVDPPEKPEEGKAVPVPKATPAPVAAPSVNKDAGANVIAYTDGSYNPDTGQYGYGVVYRCGDDVTELSGCGEDLYNGRQIPGEVKAALCAVEKAIGDGASSIEIRYDYMGVEMWATGKWRTNKEYTAEYAKKMRDYGKRIQVSFRHVTAHTGEETNEKVDLIAKKACGVEVRSEADYPPYHEGLGKIDPAVHDRCKNSIKDFYKKKDHAFKDYMLLSTYGQDDISKYPLSHLEQFALEYNLEPYIQGREFDSGMFASYVRWCIRGLLPLDAAKKVEVDIDRKKALKKGGGAFGGGLKPAM